MSGSVVLRYARLMAGAAFLAALQVSAVAAPQPRFATPEAAVAALRTALAAGQPEGVVAIFGTDHADLVVTGDAATDADTYKEAVRRLDLYQLLDPVAKDRRVLLVGEQAWPFPIPIVRERGGWRFASELGREELLDRRVGGNELYVIDVMRAYIEAQHHYALADRNGDGVREYAQRLGSAPGKRDGLYWSADETKGEEPSPWGPLIAGTSLADDEVRDERQGYRGYRYRVLSRQGAGAEGGAFNYIVNGRMLAGFALIAYPVDYGNSGVKSFIVNRNGRIYERDLGPETVAMAQAMTMFDPGDGWLDVDR